jgi:thiamine biosynthesis lipoprotein
MATAVIPTPAISTAVMPRPLVHVEHVMGTVVSFDVRFAAESQRVPMRAAVTRAVNWLHWVDDVFSTYRHDSELSRLGRGELRLAECHGDLAAVLELCAQVGRESAGYFSSTYGGKLDPTGLVKGWAIQRASERLSSAGSAHHLVNGGGDIQAVGGCAPGIPWQVGIAHPLERGAFASVVRLTDGAVATSGLAERGAHVLDPFTGQPAVLLASVTVVGRDLIRTDAYATAAIAMGARAPRWLEGRAGYEAFAVAADGLGWWTPGYARVGSVPAT